MKSLIPLFPFVAALGLLACQGDDGPVAEGAAPSAESGDTFVGDGLSGPANAAAAEAADRAAAPAADNGMGWTSDGGGASFGPQGARPLLRFACDGDVLRVTRFHPAAPGRTATLSFTGGGTASSLPMRAIARPGDPGESEWQGEARGDMARAVMRAFARGGPVNVTLGGAPSLAVQTSPVVDGVFKACAA